MHDRNSAATPRRWHQEPMLWLVIAIPLLTALGGAVSFALIARHADRVLIEVAPVATPEQPR